MEIYIFFKAEKLIATKLYSWVENNFSLSRTHVDRSTEPHLVRFLYWSVDNIKTCRALSLERCHHVVCSHIFDRPLRNIKLDRHLVPTGSFFVFQFADDFRDAYTKKLPMKSQRKAIIDDFFRGLQYERLEGHIFLNFLAYNGNEDVPIREYFRFVHAVNLPLAFFYIHLRCG